MAKAKKNKSKSVPNKHVHARVSFLYQTAAYLQLAEPNAVKTDSPTPIPRKVYGDETAQSEEDRRSSKERPLDAMHHENATELEDGADLRHTDVTSKAAAASFGGDQRLIMSHIRLIMQKSRIQVSPDIKRTMCKRCATLLTPSSTCAMSMENASRGGKKPWADVLVKTCLNCGASKRFPVGANRQARKKDRAQSKPQPVATQQA